ncbi:hypothetical protein Fcan01_04270 [Folsomia candida]|uniref:Uncharacterized protein n=1 Tax=Folsomia candida TaxID=158441 RepID=A0A226EQ75_FOLCA|nr:hypothetical protein Fcan01_04270 [Folsomia candida]
MITSGSEDNNIPNNINSLRNFSNHARCGDGDDDDKPRSGGCGTSCDGGDTPGVTKREGTPNIERRSKVLRSYVILVIFYFLIEFATPEKLGRRSENNKVLIDLVQVEVDDFQSTATKLASVQDTEDGIITESSPSPLPEPRRGSNKNNKKAKKPSNIVKSYHQNRGDFSDATTSSSSKEFLTQLFTKWMSFGPTEMTASSSSSYMGKSLTGYQKYRVIEWLSSKVKEWWSQYESSTGRTFLLAPLLTAIPMMAVEILAIGSLGVFAPAFMILAVVLFPLLLIGFIIFI